MQIAGHPPLRLDEGHALLVGATGSRRDASRRSPSGRSPTDAVALVVALDVAMRLFAADALTPRGWERDVAIDVDADGTIARIEAECEARWRGARGRAAGAGHAESPLARVPARACGTHRTARARTATRSGRGARRCTRFSTAIDADAFEAIAAQAYVEMLKAGYTAVAEFHYVHHDPQGKPYADPAELAHRIVAAAGATGIALTLLPVFYAHADFGGAPPTEGQRRFVHSLDTYAQLVAALAREAATAGCTLGVAPHSLRAVTPDELAAIVALAPRGADPYSRGGADARSRRVRRVERRAAGRMAARRTRRSMRAGASFTRRT